MDLVGEILKGQLERLKSLEQFYLDELKKLPTGSIQMKRIKGKPYPYRVWSIHSKLHYEYLGKLSPLALSNLKFALAQRKNYQKELKTVQKDLAKVTRLVRKAGGEL